MSEEARCSPQPWADRGRGKSESLGPGTNGFIFLERAKSREAGEGRQLGQAELRRAGRRGRPGHCPRSKQASAEVISFKILGSLCSQTPGHITCTERSNEQLYRVWFSLSRLLTSIIEVNCRSELKELSKSNG